MAQDPATGGASTGGSGDSLASLRRSAAELSAGLVALQEAQKLARRQTLRMVVVVVVLTLIFVLGTINRVRSNFESAKIQEAAKKQMPGLVQDMRLRFQDVGIAVAPTYQDAAKAKFEEIRPDLEKSFVAAGTAMREEVAAAAKKKMQDRLDAMMKRLEPDLRQAFPDLPEAKKIQLTERFEHRLQDQTGEILGHVEKQYTNELYKLDQALDGFDVQKAARQDKTELEKQFVRLLIKLVDHHVSQAWPTTQQTVDAGGAAVR
jgi:membrane-associated HD superfamily phosphohydrolase